MKLKDGVILAGLKLEMRIALLMAEDIWASLGQELVVTSALDGVHSAGSLHYYGYALDFRTRYFNDQEKRKAFEELVDELPEFHVIWHDSHIHVEYDKVL